MGKCPLLPFNFIAHGSLISTQVKSTQPAILFHYSSNDCFQQMKSYPCLTNSFIITIISPKTSLKNRSFFNCSYIIQLYIIKP